MNIEKVKEIIGEKNRYSLTELEDICECADSYIRLGESERMAVALAIEDQMDFDDDY